jgi:hypothetical protein
VIGSFSLLTNISNKTYFNEYQFFPKPMAIPLFFEVLVGFGQ